MSTGPEDQLRLGGLNVLLLLDPPAAMSLLETGYAARGRVAVDEASAMWERWLGGLGAASRWAVAELGRLLRLLLRAYPLDQDTDEEDDGEAHFATDADQLRWFRNHLFDALLRTRTAQAVAIIDAIARESVAVGNWVAATRAAEEARALLGTAFTADSADPSAIHLTSALRVLDSAAYRLIRSEDDLLEVVLDVLQTIEADVAGDPPMLYGAPPKAAKPQRKGKSKTVAKASAVPRKHLQEDALQAYLRRRLCDLLPGRADGMSVEVLRENQVQYRRRLDILVLAPCLGRRELAAVVIEVKWSDNDETETSLQEQLGRKYLKKEGRTHGVYLVGWAGSWKQKGRKKSGQAALLNFLISQRDRDCSATGKGLRIEPVVLGLTWRDPADK